MKRPREVSLLQLAYLYDFNHRKGEYNYCVMLAESILDVAQTQTTKNWCERVIQAEGRVHINVLWAGW